MAPRQEWQFRPSGIAPPKGKRPDHVDIFGRGWMQEAKFTIISTLSNCYAWINNFKVAILRREPTLAGPILRRWVGGNLPQGGGNWKRGERKGTCRTIASEFCRRSQASFTTAQYKKFWSPLKKRSWHLQHISLHWRGANIFLKVVPPPCLMTNHLAKSYGPATKLSVNKITT